jgi:hypothetical protein
MEKPGGPPGHQSPVPRWLGKMQTSLLSISTLMLPVYIFETFLFDSLFCFFLLVCLFIFPFFFNLFSFPPLSPFHSKYYHCYYYKLENNCTQYRDSNNTKGNNGKTENTGKRVSPQQKISTGTRGKWRKQIIRSRLQQNEDKLCQRTQWSPQE